VIRTARSIELCGSCHRLKRENIWNSPMARFFWSWNGVMLFIVKADSFQVSLVLDFLRARVLKEM
jgi:hypothetical protein